VLELVVDVFAKELLHTGVIHIGGPSQAHTLFSRVLHLVKAVRADAAKMDAAQVDAANVDPAKVDGRIDAAQAAQAAKTVKPKRGARP
jgi:hypothetical protein